MRMPKWLFPAAMAVCGLVINVSHSYGKAEYTKKEKKPCTACHTSAKSKDLNAVGKCYETKKSMADCATKK